MKSLTLKEEAERLKVPLDSVVMAIRKSMSAGRIHGIIDTANQEFVCYEPEELNRLIERLNAERVSISELAEEFNIRTSQMRLIIHNLLGEKKVGGILFPSDDIFLSEELMEQLIYDHIKSTENINIHSMAENLNISEERIGIVLYKTGRRIVNVVKPYEKIGFADLSREINLPENITIILLKNLISNRELEGSLDMVNHVLTINQMPKPSTGQRRELFNEQISHKQEVLTSKPSSAWYLVPIFLGIIGGVVGYIAVKDEDRSMANNLLYIGIASSIIGTIIIWGFYSWYLSQLFRWVYRL